MRPKKTVVFIATLQLLTWSSASAQVHFLSKETQKELQRTVGLYIGPTSMFGVKKKTTREKVTVFDAGGRSREIDYIIPQPGSRAEKWFKGPVTSKVNLDGKLMISLSEALKASKNGSSVSLAAGFAKFPTVIVKPEAKDWIYFGHTIGVGEDNLYAYEEYVIEARPLWLSYGDWDGVTIAGSPASAPIDYKKLLNLPQPKSARGKVRRFFETFDSSDSSTLLVPTIKSLERDFGGFALPKENFGDDLTPADLLLPTSGTVIVVSDSYSSPPETQDTYGWSFAHPATPLAILEGRDSTISDVTFMGTAAGHFTTDVRPWDNATLVSISKSENITLSDCSFMNSTGTALRISNSRNVRIERCVFAGSIREAIVAHNSTVAIVDSIFLGNGRGWREKARSRPGENDVILPGDSISAFESLVIIKGNYFKASGANSLFADEASDIVAEENIFDEPYGLQFRDCNRLATTISSNLSYESVVSGAIFFSVGNQFPGSADRSSKDGGCRNLALPSNLESSAQLDQKAALAVLEKSHSVSEAEFSGYAQAFEAAQIAYQKTSDPWSSFWRGFLGCTAEMYLGAEIDEPIAAALATKSLRSIIDGRNVSMEELEKEILKNYVKQALEEADNPALNATANVADFLACLVSD